MIFGNSDIEFSIIRDIENARIKAYEKGCKAFAFATTTDGIYEITRESGIRYHVLYIRKNKTDIKMISNYVKIFQGQLALRDGKEIIIFPTRLENASMVR